MRLGLPGELPELVNQLPTFRRQAAVFQRRPLAVQGVVGVANTDLLYALCVGVLELGSDTVNVGQRIGFLLFIRLCSLEHVPDTGEREGENHRVSSPDNGDHGPSKIVRLFTRVRGRNASDGVEKNQCAASTAYDNKYVAKH